MKKTASLPSLLALSLLALSAPAANDGAAVYRPGLVQARIPLGSPLGYKTAYQGVPNLASNLLEVADASWLDRTLDVFKGGGDTNELGETFYDDNATNPVSGKTWPWLIESQHGVFAYEGELFVEEGTNYYFYARCGDGAAMVVDGETVVWQGTMSAYNTAPAIRRFWTAPKTGWVPFNVWFWTFENRPWIQWSQWGAQYNLAGLAVEGPELNSVNPLTRRDLALNKNVTNVWQRFVDSGHGSFLRTVTGEKFTTVGESAASMDGRSFDLSFADVPTNAQLVAFSGPADGVHATNAWSSVSAVLAEVPPGTSTTNVVVPLAADATVLRFRLARFNPASTNGLETFEEWTDLVPVTAAPVLRIASAAPGWTNVVVAGSLGSFGIGGASAVVTVEVSATDDAGFANPVASVSLPSVSAVGPFEANLFGLATNTAYLVRATARNDQNVVGFSAPVSFSTRDPGPASISVAPSVCALFSVDLTATVSDWGGGSWDAEAWIDVSASSNFPAGETQTFSLGALSGATPVAATATATGLEAAHGYFARVRAVNSWGVASVSETLAFSTSADPIGFPEEATVVAEKGKVTASLAPTFVTEGVRYDVTLAMEGIAGTRSWKNQTGFGPFVHTQYSAAGTEVVFVYTIVWTYGELSGTIEVRGQAIAKLADRTIHRVPEIDPATGGQYLRPGDTVEIALPSGLFVDWHTNDVLSVTRTNGVYLLEALEPGATLLFETLADGTTNAVTGVAIVLPKNNPAGGIYVHRALKNFSWNDPSEWEVVAPGSGDYPNGAGSMVIIATDVLGPDDGQRNAEIVEPTTVGWLAVGQLGWIRHGYMVNGITKNLKSHNPWIFSDQLGAGGSLRFDTGDGSTSWIRLLGHSYTTSRTHFEVPVSMANDLDIDEMDRVQDTAGWQNTRYRGLWFKKPVDVGTNTFRTVRAHPYRYKFNASWGGGSQGSGMESTGWISFRHNVFGSGTIRLEAQTAFGLCGADGAHVSPFTGTWDVANGDLDPRINMRYGAAALNTYGLSLGQSKEMIIRGSWHRAEKTWPRGALVRTGFNDVRTSSTTSNGQQSWSWTNDWQNALPPKITLDGGDLQLFQQGPPDTATMNLMNSTGIRRHVFRVDEMHIPTGPMGRLECKVKSNDTSHHNVRTEITNLVLGADAVVSFDLDADKSNVTCEFFIVNEPFAWVPAASTEKQFLPYFFANDELEGTGGNTIEDMSVTSVTDKDQPGIRLAFRDRETGKVTLETPATEGTGYRLWTTGEELGDGASYYAMLLAANVTNSFASGATVANLAGYLDMRGGAALGVPGEDGDATVDFGDRLARVYVGNWGETGTVGCKLAGTAGLVKGGNGILALAASADGIAGGVRVAGGTLRLGATVNGTNHVGRIGGDITVEAGSRLVVGDKASIVPGSKLYLNDRNWIPSFAHVRIEDKAIVREIVVDGEPLPHGWYGSSDSAAKHVDDVHFEGPGMIHAGSFPTMMILR